jgi:hypothetical protein
VTQRNQSGLEFAPHFSRRVVVHFDGGAPLLRATGQRLHLLGRLAGCFTDHRNPLLISHTLAEMVSQRVYALALGCQDLNDHEQLRDDPMLRMLSGKRHAGKHALAGKSTLNRLELSTEEPDR